MQFLHSQFEAHAKKIQKEWKEMEEGLDTNSNRQQRYESQRWGFSRGQPVFTP